MSLRSWSAATSAGSWNSALRFLRKRTKIFASERVDKLEKHALKKKVRQMLEPKCSNAPKRSL